MIKLLNILVLVSACFCGSASAAVDVEHLLVQVEREYQQMQSFEARGQAILQIEGRTPQKFETSFTIRLKKPNLYRIVWEAPMPLGRKQTCAVWNSGDGPYLYMGIINAYSKMRSDQMALAAATGISGGAAQHIPSLFFATMDLGVSPVALGDPKLLPTETVEGQECYVITGRSKITDEQTLWISEKRDLIIKSCRSLAPPSGERGRIPKMTDAQIEEALRAMGQEVTEASKRRVRNMMERVRATTTDMDLKGTHAIVYNSITIDRGLVNKDFEYQVPKGAVLKDSLLGAGLAVPRPRRELPERVRGTRGKTQQDAHMLAMEGSRLSGEQAESLEKSLESNPNDLLSRTKLLGYYFLKAHESPSEQTRRRKHVLWLIANQPGAETAGLPEAGLDSVLDQQAYHQAKTLWLEHVENNSANTAILGNAANFFLLHDSEIAEELLKEARDLEPDNPDWSERLGHLYALRYAHEADASRRATAAKSLRELERALSSITDDLERFYLLADVGKAALEAGDTGKAGAYATELLDRASQHKSDWNYGNAVHHGNLILGRLALRLGDLEGAREHLFEAGKTPGSPQLNSFGPNMTLAKELLGHGEKEAVVKYLHLCAAFWEMGQDSLREWTSIIEAGGIPDFGANLQY